MAFPPKIPRFPLLLTLYFLCFPPQISSLSTASISNIFNQTLVCALIPSSDRRSFLRCTLFPSRIVQIPVKSQNVSYSRIVGGNGFLCALRSHSLSSSTSVMECWRFSAKLTKMSHKRIYRGWVLRKLEAGDSHVCGLVNRSNALKCWHWKPRRSVGEDFVCGLDGNSHIFCLGNDANVIGKEPSGNYSVVAAGTHHACAISLNGSLDCWGNGVGMKPEGQFKDLAIGDDRSCAMHINGTVICWGVDDFRIPRRLKETYFTGIVGKQGVFCGVVSSNYSLLCWGDEILGGNFVVFGNVMPGTCTAQCPSCGPLPGYGYFCGEGLMVCQPCAKATMDEGYSPMVPSAPQSSKPSTGSSSWSAKLVGFLVVGCLGFMSLLASVIFFIVFRCNGGRASQVHVLGCLEETLNNQGTRQRPKPKLVKKRLSHMYSIDNGGNLEEFPLEVLLQVTNNFSEDHRMGRGSFGCVYHAILADGREVAIKRAELHSSQHRKVDKDTAFMAELEVLSRLNHKHLVKLIGFFEDTNERVLVYEFMSNSTLHHHLHKLKGNSLLASWPARVKVALDAARGIEYLHKYADPPIIHRDIKSSNILLDADWTAKVSDFGLSLMGPRAGESHLSIQPVGTFGYVDPEYYKLDQLTTKSDVYSFGVVLLELLSGYKAVHANEDGTPTNVLHFVAPCIIRGDIHKVLDPCVQPPTPVEIEAVENLGFLAMDCVSPEGRNRPSMSGVVSRLDRALAACLAPPITSNV